MINQMDILAALQSGADAEKIANDFAAALNAAIAEKAKADLAKREAEEKAAREAELQKQKKINRMADLIDLLLDFLEDFYPDLYETGLRDAVNAEAAVRIFDEAYAEMQKMTPVLNDLNNLLQKLEDGGVKIEQPRSKHCGIADDPIANFLKNHNL